MATVTAAKSSEEGDDLLMIPTLANKQLDFQSLSAEEQMKVWVKSTGRPYDPTMDSLMHSDARMFEMPSKRTLKSVDKHMTHTINSL